MAVETEIKLPIEDGAEFLHRLAGLNPVLISARHFEDNHVLDYNDGRIRAARSLIRVRITDHASLLTYKGPVLPAGVFKSREEIESAVESGAAVLRILEELGLRTWFRYQKYREEHRVIPVGRPEETVIVAVDETPIGRFAELEGPEDGIREIAGAMGYSESQYMRDSYYTLYCRFCYEHGTPVSHMIFPLDLGFKSSAI